MIAQTAVSAPVFRPAAPQPSPAPLRLFRRLAALRANPIRAFHEEAYRAQMLSLSRLRPVVLVNDPQAIVRVLIDNAENYRKSVQQRRRLEPALGNGLLTAEGTAWKGMRRMTAPLFTPLAIERLQDDMRDATADMIARWHMRADRTAPLDLVAEFQRLTYDIVSRTVFSGELDADRATVHAHMATYFDTVGRVDLSGILGLPAWWPDISRLRVTPSVRVFRKVIEQAVMKRPFPANGDNDLLDKLLATKVPGTSEYLPHETVIDNVLTFLAAGHETTANSLCWTFYLLTQSPSAFEGVRAEAAQLEGDVFALADKLKSLTFCRAVINESMRLYPPVPFIGREALNSDRLAGHNVQQGTQLVISPWIVHRHHALWPNPELFRPERFLTGATDQQTRGSYLPFGLGPRTCIGNGFAMQEMLIVLTSLAREFAFELVEPQAVEPLANITLRPKNGLWVRVKPRQ